MTRHVGIKHIPDKTGKIYYFKNTIKGIRIGDEVLVETSRGIALGRVWELDDDLFPTRWTAAHQHVLCIANKKEE